ncbi:MAG: mechanosensitive ion channel family protein, partial [Stagnimonas sp.]|nr:mechanosensitive ion channel family protein [Stagnimonas sp.]
VMSDLAQQLDMAQLAQGCVRVSVVLLLWWLLSRAVETLLSRLGDRLISQAATNDESPVEARKRVETLVRLLTQVVRIVLFVTLALVLLMQLGVQVGPLLASAGIIGLAVGFGAQSLVKDIITGFFMVMENQLRVGDVVTINGTGGLVETMTLRTVVLRDLSGTVHIFPNGNVTTLSNLTRGWSAYVFDIGVAYKEDPDVAIAALREIADKLQSDPYFGPKIIEPAEIFGVDKLGESAVVIKGRIKTLPITQWEVGREFLRRVKKAFDEQGIEIPFPHRTLYIPDLGPKADRLAALGKAASQATTNRQPREDVGSAEG